MIYQLHMTRKIYIAAVLGVLGVTGHHSVHAQYAVDTPWILPCPDENPGEFTVVKTTRIENPWVVEKSSCSSNGKLIQREILTKWVNANPPKEGDLKRWEERCPTGTIGTLRYLERQGRRYIETWSCANNNSLMTFEELKLRIEQKKNSDGSDGLQQVKQCPPPYTGTYSLIYEKATWTVSQWSCAMNGKKVSKDTMQMITSP